MNYLDFSWAFKEGKSWQMWADKLSLQVADLQTKDKQQQQQQQFLF